MTIFHEQVNFEYKGRKLTARAGYDLKEEAEEASGDEAYKGQMDFVLGEVDQCYDSNTKITVEVTEGMKAAIILELRKKWDAEREEINEGDKGTVLDPAKWRIFKR